MTPDLIVLVGLSGSGKSTVGRLVASRLGWDFVDSDALVESAAARPIPEIFADEGEEGFRAREAAVLDEATSRHRTVLATGGGALTAPGAREFVERGFSVWLAVSPEHAARRLAENPDTEERPLLAGDAVAQLRAQLARRRALYETADAAVDVDALSPEQTALEIVRLWEEAGGRAGPGDGSAADGRVAVTGGGVAAVVRTPGASYPIVVRNGSLAQVGQLCLDVGLNGRAFVVGDTTTLPLFGDRVTASLRDAGMPAQSSAIPEGEDQKTLATVSLLYDWLLEARVERSDFVVCVGGGVVTDLAGFAAATCLRGIDFVHVPTTLLAMADAAVGGKTGVDHPMGKNLIGAFAQPRAVVIDPEVLASLSLRQQRAGWAEVIKHGLILDGRLVADLEAGATAPGAMMSPELIGRSVAIKAEIVSEDEREAGRRTLLNYGHTVGHAIEAVAGYGTYLHGEAVAVGMRVAGAISVAMGMLSSEGLARQQQLLLAYGLPDTVTGLDLEAVLAATASDKKVRAGSVRWVLLEEVGRAVVRADVPEDVVRTALREVLR